MRKNLFIGAFALISCSPLYAGDYLTNTNQHAAFLRMAARGASIDIDGAYSNPAGLAFLQKDGFFLSLTGQSAYQTREIHATSPLWTMDGQNTTQYFKGTASAPIIPSFHGAYKKDKWVVSAAFAITGGGGKASFSNGLPMFNALATGLISQKTGGMVKPNMYRINSAMDGKQYIYGFQLGASYRINDWVSVYAGGRMNYFTGGYEGFLNASLTDDYKAMAPALGLPDATLASIDLKCDQQGWGVTPILGADFKWNKLNIGLKYEFKANLNIENVNTEMELFNVSDAYLADYKEGVNTPSDIPAMLSVAAGYEILPCLRASVEYHFFDDKHAGMAADRQKTLKHGTHEYLAGVEWDVMKYLTLSGGFQKTNYGLSDDFQTDASFYCDSYSLGGGARVHFNESLSLDVAYFWTKYSDYTKASTDYYGIKLAGTNVYGRTNKVFGVSLNYNF